MKLCITIGSIALAGVALTAIAATPAQDATARKPPQDAAQAGGMDDMSGMMPNEHHKKLARMVGEWHADVSMFTPDGQPADKNTGEVTIRTIMGGRYVLEDVKGGPMPGMGNFEGMGISGYNNRTGKYENTWLDNVGTAQLHSIGEEDATGNMVWRSEQPNMMTGKMEPTRSVMRRISDTEAMYEVNTTTDGKEWKSMEIHYTKTG